MQRQGAFREAVLRYAKESFDSEPEYLWAKFPGYAVLRHAGPGQVVRRCHECAEAKTGPAGRRNGRHIGCPVRPDSDRLPAGWRAVSSCLSHE